MKFAITHSGITVTCFGANKKELIKDLDEAIGFVIDQVSVNLIKPKKKKRVVAKKKEQPADSRAAKTEEQKSPGDFQAKIIKKQTTQIKET